MLHLRKMQLLFNCISLLDYGNLGEGEYQDPDRQNPRR